MVVIIKKIIRGAAVSIAVLGSMIVALLARIFLGESHIDISKIDSQAADAISKVVSANKAQADVLGSSGDGGGSASDGYEGCTDGGGCTGDY